MQMVCSEQSIERSACPKVSVIVAVYNAEDYLKQCLSSICGQTLKEIEIICVNDGSSDRSEEIIREYEKTDSRIILINQKNRGAGAARNAGLRMATGKYLSFLDADDFFELDMLEKAYRKVEESKADICVWQSDKFLQSSDRYELCSDGFHREFFPIDTPFCPSKIEYRTNLFRMFSGWAWDKLFRRRFVQDNGILFQEIRTTNDMLFVYMSLAKAQRIVCFEGVLTHRRIQVFSSLSMTRELSWDCFYLALLALKEELKRSGLYSVYRQAYVNWALNLSLWHLYTLTGKARQNAYHLMKSVGFAKLDVAKYPLEYFFSEYEYNQMVKILTATCVDEL